MSSSTDRPAKKPYETPKLFVYGDIREITKNVGNMGAADGGMSPNDKTSP